MSSTQPVVLCFSGHDPSGGAGVQADIETITSHRCHCCSVITALTEQDSRNVNKVIPQKPQDFLTQAYTLLNDYAVNVIKIGLIGHPDIAKSIAEILKQNPTIPVVLDPIFAAGGGTQLATDQLISTLRDQILPLTDIVTPNSEEARILAGEQNLEDCGQKLIKLGCQTVLITGTHEQSELVNNQLFQVDLPPETFHWERLPNHYHGSGCTLASSIAALIAHGLDPFTAISEAQEYTWQSLQASAQIGKGQFNPDRLFWMEQT